MVCLPYTIAQTSSTTETTLPVTVETGESVAPRRNLPLVAAGKSIAPRPNDLRDIDEKEDEKRGE
jgi:hypothetical protein